jgi:flagellin
MAMTVGGVNSYVSNYNRITSATQKTIHQISRGEKFPDAAAGASDYAIAVRLASNIGITSQSIRNTQNIGSAIKISEGALENTIKGLKTIKEQVTNAANDTNDNLDREAIQKGINEIVSEINSNAYVDYNGRTLLDGSQSSLVFAGINGYENFQAGDIRTSTLGLTDNQGNVKIDVSTRESATNSLKIVDQAMNVVGSILDGMHIMGDYISDGFNFENALEWDKIQGSKLQNVDFQEASKATMNENLKGALDVITTQGAQLQGLEFKEKRLIAVEENQTGALSAINDEDIAKQVIKLNTNDVLTQFATYGTRMYNQNRINISQLLP